jgi:prevent-host-death family protein
MTIWKLEEAKNRFSEVVRRAQQEGPQLVTKHGRQAAVVLGSEDYRCLSEKGGLVEFLSRSPLAAAFEAGELRLERATDLARDVEL